MLLVSISCPRHARDRRLLTLDLTPAFKPSPLRHERSSLRSRFSMQLDGTSKSLLPTSFRHNQVHNCPVGRRFGGSAPHPKSARLSSAPAPKQAISASIGMRYSSCRLEYQICLFGELSPTDLMQSACICPRRLQCLVLETGQGSPGHRLPPFRSSSQIDRVDGSCRRLATALHPYRPKHCGDISAMP